MKKLLLTLALAVGAINSGFAADLYVNNSGQSGTYTTIQAAINAASTGDNIYVSPLNSYQESLSITKSIRIASSVSGSRIIVTQDIKISPLANILVELIGIEGTDVLLDTQTSTLGINSRGKAIITDCSFHDVNLDTDYLTLWIVRCTLSGTLTGRHGKVIGNTISEEIIIKDEPNIGIGDSIIIKANQVDKGISTATNDYSLIIQNNKTTFISVFNWLYGSQVNCLISNNTITATSIITSTQSGYYTYNDTDNKNGYRIHIASTSTNLSNVSITNNALICPKTVPTTGAGSNRYRYWYRFIGTSGSTVTVNPDVSYNLDGQTQSSNTSYHIVYKGNSTYATGIYTLIEESNVVNPLDETSVTNYLHAFKDLGSPSPKFQDIDLTRSGIGHLCGDNSWEMYHGTNSVSGAAYIIGLDLPSEIWPGQTVDLKAEAVHTN
jgi:hypothetical protein